jgi:hypothetical protein
LTPGPTLCNVTPSSSGRFVLVTTMKVINMIYSVHCAGGIGCNPYSLHQKWTGYIQTTDLNGKVSSLEDIRPNSHNSWIDDGSPYCGSKLSLPNDGTYFGFDAPGINAGPLLDWPPCPTPGQAIAKGLLKSAPSLLSVTSFLL